MVEYAWAGMDRSPRASTNDSVMDEDAWHHPEGGSENKEQPRPPDFNTANEGAMLMRDMPTLGKRVPEARDGILRPFLEDDTGEFLEIR